MFAQSNVILLRRYENAMGELEQKYNAGLISAADAREVAADLQRSMMPLMARKNQAEAQAKMKAINDLHEQSVIAEHMQAENDQFRIQNMQNRIGRTPDGTEFVLDDKNNPQIAPWQQAKFEMQKEQAQRDHEMGMKAQDQVHEQRLQEVDPAGVNLFGAGLLAGAMPGASPEAAPQVSPGAGGHVAYGGVNWTRHDAQMAVNQAIQRYQAAVKAAREPNLQQLYPEATTAILSRYPPPWQETQRRLAQWRNEHPMPQKPAFMENNDAYEAEVDRIFKHGVAAVRAQMGSDPKLEAQQKAAEEKRLKAEEDAARKADEADKARRRQMEADIDKLAAAKYTTKRVTTKDGQRTEEKDVNRDAAYREYHARRMQDFPNEYGGFVLKPHESQYEALMAKRKADAAAAQQDATEKGYGASGNQTWNEYMQQGAYAPGEPRSDAEAARQAIQQRLDAISSETGQKYTMEDYDRNVAMFNQLGAWLKGLQGGGGGGESAAAAPMGPGTRAEEDRRIAGVDLNANPDADIEGMIGAWKQGRAEGRPPEAPALSDEDRAIIEGIPGVDREKLREQQQQQNDRPPNLPPVMPVF